MATDWQDPPTHSTLCYMESTAQNMGLALQPETAEHKSPATTADQKGSRLALGSPNIAAATDARIQLLAKEQELQQLRQNALDQTEQQVLSLYGVNAMRGCLSLYACVPVSILVTALPIMMHAAPSTAGCPPRPLCQGTALFMFTLLYNK